MMIKTKRKSGQITLEYAVLIAAVLVAMMVFNRYLNRAVEDKMATFEEETQYKSQTQ